MSNNPFIDFDQLPNFSKISPEYVSDAVDTVITRAEKTIEEIAVDKNDATWETVCAPIDSVCESITRVWNQIEHMNAVMNSPQWVEVYQQNLPKVVMFFTRLGQHEGVYKRFCTLQEEEKKREGEAILSLAQRKVVDDAVRDFEHSGVSLSADKKEIFRKNSEKLASLSAEFEEHLLAATNAFFLTIDDENLLLRMPQDLRAVARATASKKGEEGWCFTLHAPSYTAFMKYVDDRQLREKMYRAYFTRASDFGPEKWNNLPLANTIVTLRQQQAELLGFCDYSTLALQTRMAENPQMVFDFLRDLSKRTLPHAKSELEILQQFASAELGISDCQAWDIPYVSELLRQQQFDYSEADLRPYLREDKILSGLFDCIYRLFGVSMREKKVDVWCEDVRYYELLSSDERVLGGVYMDLYTRESKRGGAWMSDVLSRYRRLNNHLQLPLASITCNFTRSVSSQSLLNWDEVVTLFHEFGHALHHLLTEIDEFSISGISGVEWDAVELPSQWLENFVWDWEVLLPMTAHVDSGDPMPKALFDKVIASRRFLSGLFLVRQLEFALFDVLLHSDKSISVEQAISDARNETAVLFPPSYNRFACGFSHIFAGGYSAGYYSYLWAEVLAVDVFAMFKDSDNVLDATLGNRFREHILAVGGSRLAMESFVAMRGRKPDTAALLSHYGLE